MHLDMFDSLKYSKVLEAVGISQNQVEGELATKQDVRELKDELVKLEYRLIIKLGALITAFIAVAVTILKLG